MDEKSKHVGQVSEGGVFSEQTMGLVREPVSSELWPMKYFVMLKIIS